jgi:hypothetical protein
MPGATKRSPPWKAATVTADALMREWRNWQMRWTQDSTYTGLHESDIVPIVVFREKLRVPAVGRCCAESVPRVSLATRLATLDRRCPPPPTAARTPVAAGGLGSQVQVQPQLERDPTDRGRVPATQVDLGAIGGDPDANCTRVPSVAEPMPAVADAVRRRVKAVEASGPSTRRGGEFRAGATLRH